MFTRVFYIKKEWEIMKKRKIIKVREKKNPSENTLFTIIYNFKFEIEWKPDLISKMGYISEFSIKKPYRNNQQNLTSKMMQTSVIKHLKPHSK